MGMRAALFELLHQRPRGTHDGSARLLRRARIKRGLWIILHRVVF